MITENRFNSTVRQKHRDVFRESPAVVVDNSINRGVGAERFGIGDCSFLTQVKPTSKSTVVSLQSETGSGKCSDYSVPGTPVFGQVNPCLIGQR